MVVETDSALVFKNDEYLEGGGSWKVDEKPSSEPTTLLYWKKPTPRTVRQKFLRLNNQSLQNTDSNIFVSHLNAEWKTEGISSAPAINSFILEDYCWLQLCKCAPLFAYIYIIEVMGTSWA